MAKKIRYVVIIKGILILVLLAYSNPRANSHFIFHKNRYMNNSLRLQTKVSGEGTPLLLVPGGLTGWKSWEPFEKTFSEKQRKVITVQLMNVEYGFENRPLPAGYSVKTESNALAASIESLGTSAPLDVVAWSYGALVTLDYALDHPKRIRTLTLIEPPAIWVLRVRGDIDAETQHILNSFETFHGEITDDMLAAFLKEAGFTKPGQSPLDLPQWQQWQPFRQALRNNPAIVVQRDKLKRLRDFRQPVLLVKGTGSALFLHRIIDDLSTELPDSRTIELPAGHAPHLVSRDDFLKELEKFQTGSVK
jgi:pimeloyl-ACP methyl ester carboxylesterase